MPDASDKKPKLILPAGMEDAPPDGGHLFYPRVWVVVKHEQGVVKMDTRAMHVDAKLAAGNLLKAVQKGQVKHFDEMLAEAREPKDLKIHYITLRDDTSGREVEFELTNVDEKGVTAFIDGLNQFEAVLVSQALQMLRQE